MIARRKRCGKRRRPGSIPDGTTEAKLRCLDVAEQLSSTTPPAPSPPSAAWSKTLTGRGVEKLKEAGGLWPPASLKNLPLPRPDTLTSTACLAGGGVGGVGGAVRRPLLSGQGPLCPGGLNAVPRTMHVRASTTDIARSGAKGSIAEEVVRPGVAWARLCLAPTRSGQIRSRLPEPSGPWAQGCRREAPP
jgi:hypothetical protein